MSNDSAATLQGIVATGQSVGGVNSASTGNSQCVLQSSTASSATADGATSSASLQAVAATNAGGYSNAQVALQPIQASGMAVTGVTTSSANVPVSLPFIIAGGEIYPVGLSSVEVGSFAAAGAELTGERGISSVTLENVAAAGVAGTLAVGSSAATLQPISAASSGYLGTGAAFSAVVMHTETQSLWTYSNFGFNSFAKFQGQILAAGDAGLFTLGGAKDNGVNIDAQATFGITDFSTAHEKRVERVYLGYRSTGNLILRVTVDETKTRDYLVAANTPLNTGLHGRHVKLGRGVEAKYYQFSVLNKDGSDFSLNMLECKPTVLRRRVGGGIDA